jgi:hypothetical protein
MTRNRLLLCGLALALALAGCKKSKPAAEEDEGPSKQDIRQGIGRQAPAFARYNAATDLKTFAGLYVFYTTEHGNRPPARLEDLNLRQDAAQVAKAFEEGAYVAVLGGAAVSQVVAYEKDAPERGGMVAQRDGSVVRMTAEELKAALQGR